MGVREDKLLYLSAQAQMQAQGWWITCLTVESCNM